MPKATTKNRFKRLWHKTLADYVTAIAWSQDGTWLIASSAAGDVVQYGVKTGEMTVLQEAAGESVDVLALSAEGQLLAAGGQAGTVWIWRLAGRTATLIEALKHPRVWIDRLQWHPQHPELAFSFGRSVQVWDAMAQSVITTLNFESSSVLDLAWRPQGDRLSVSGNQSIKTWRRQNWDDDPTVLETGAASEAIAWSPEGTYLAAGNHDGSVWVWEDGNPDAWQMTDFPGTVRQLAWSMLTKSGVTPLLASISLHSVVVWTKDPIASIGWNPQLLATHQGILTAIAFQPKSLLLASAAEDGLLCLWHKGSRLIQTLKGAPAEFSCLAWRPSGGAIAAGTNQGEVLVWTETQARKGFR
ncbi:MAG: WD40 repeat domain-containing protein [Cyanobacteria bacterium P01_G01_bin.54]